MMQTITNVLDRWWLTEKPESWRYAAIFRYVYARVCLERAKLILARLLLPERLYWRYLLGKRN